MNANDLSESVADDSTIEVANPNLFDERIHEVHNLEVSDAGDIQMICGSLGNTHASASFQSLSQPPNQESSASTKTPTLIPSSAETLSCTSQQLGIDEDTEGPQWIDCNGFEDFDATQIGILSPSSINQWQQDFYEPSASFYPWIASSQVLLPVVRTLFVVI